MFEKKLIAIITLFQIKMNNFLIFAVTLALCAITNGQVSTFLCFSINRKNIWVQSQTFFNVFFIIPKIDFKKVHLKRLIIHIFACCLKHEIKWKLYENGTLKMYLFLFNILRKELHFNLCMWCTLYTWSFLLLYFKILYYNLLYTKIKYWWCFVVIQYANVTFCRSY